MTDMYGSGDVVAEYKRRYDELRKKCANRDVTMAQVRSVRDGRIAEIAPDMFAEAGSWSNPITANMIDIAARSMAEALGPLPTFSCTSPTMTSDRDRSRATLRTKIAQGYVYNSDLGTEAFTGTDWYASHGFVPGRVDIDFDRMTPVIRLIDPIGTYVEYDRFNRVRAFFQKILKPVSELTREYPEMTGKIKECVGWTTRDVEVVLVHDKDRDLAFVNGDKGQVTLLDVPNPIGKVLVRVAKRPGATTDTRGQFDDLIFVQAGKENFAHLAMKGAHDAAFAPLAVPDDVLDVPTGPDAVIVTANPQGVRRVQNEVSASTFQEQANLERELMQGARFPQALTGNVEQSVVTGRGVQAMMGGYDAQVRTGQQVFAKFFSELISLCFEVDEKVFGGTIKKTQGVISGSPYHVEYDPAKAIKGEYTIDVKYGLLAGMDPQMAMVIGQQALGSDLISRDFLRRNMPWDMDPEDEARKADVEAFEDGMKQAFLGLAQSIPVLAAQGQDVNAPVDALMKFIIGRSKGKSIAEIADEIANPPEPKQPSPEELAAQGIDPATGQPAAGPGGTPPYGLGPTGLLKGVAPGQAGMAPGGRPDLRMMLASLDATGSPEMSVGISKREAI